MKDSSCWLWLFCLLSASPGCGELIDFPANPVLVPDVSDPWHCLGKDTEVQAPRAETATVRVFACDFVSNCADAVEGLSVSVCNKRDVGCTNPSVTGVADQGGMVEVQVPTRVGGFDGYLKVESELARCTDEAEFGPAGLKLCALAPECDPAQPDDKCLVPKFAPALLFLNPPVRADMQQPLPLPLLSSLALPDIVQAAGAELDPSTGNLFITAMDCNGDPAPGVTYAIGQSSKKVTQLYVDQGVVSDTIFQTDSSGIGGFVGVPTGFAEVVGFNEDQEKIGKIGVQSAPFTLSYSALVPNN